MITLSACLERIRHENLGVVPACCASMAGRVLAKSFLARLAGQISQKKRRQVHKSLVCNRIELQTCT